jgi:RNA polymerase sigma factor (sigma-70 family)
VALFRPLPRPESLEDLFLERYGELLRAALAITGGRREAEDLVHDAFVRLLLAQPDPASIEHLDAYLRTVLRNLHTARLRRRAHRAEMPLSIADFDSAHFAARALTPSQWTQARHDVAAACRYACTRRLTSKTGSLFLLRFVHEIVPNDLARVVRLTRDTVDITLARGRAEVKTYLEHPARALEALGGGLVPMEMPAVEPGAEDEDDYLARVREAVFGLRHARCFEPERLQRLYAPGNDGGAIPTQILAEIVTCPRCLDLVGRLTHVPPHVEQPRDIDPPSSMDAPPPRRLPRRDPARTRRAAAIQACRAIRAHRPRMLRVLVNGFEVGTHEISGAVARVTQTVSALEPVWLVEVYSEQDVCLASLDVTPLPEAPAEQRVRVDLADDRKIELALSFLRPWPTVSLSYDDPAYGAPLASTMTESPRDIAEIVEITRALEDEDDGLPIASRDRDALAPPPLSTLPPSPERLFQWRAWTRWTEWLRSSGTPGAGQRSPRLAWGAVAFALTVWLVFFTPGTSVSAAERIWRALAALVAPESTPAPRPPAGPARQRDIPLPAPPTTTPRGRSGSPVATELTPTLLAELEIDALTALHARHALAGQRIQVTRTPVSVAVEGLVEGQDRDEIVRALREVPHGSALRVALTTTADLLGARAAGNAAGHATGGAAGGAGTAGTATLRAVTLDRNAVPAADDLRRALVSRGASGDVEGQIHRLANDGLRHSRAAFLEAATLRTLAERFDVARAAGLPDITSAKWRVLLTSQAERVANAVDQVRTQLEPLFMQGESGGSGGGSSAGSGVTPSAAYTRMAAEEHLGEAARRIADDLGQVERATRAALAVAEAAPATIELRDATFWRRLAATRDRIAAFTEHVIPR